MLNILVFTKQEVKNCWKPMVLYMTMQCDRCMMATIWEELIFTIPGRLLIMSIVELIPYWVNTSSNKMIKSAMQDCEASFKDGYEELIRTETVNTLVNFETSLKNQRNKQSVGIICECRLFNSGKLLIHYWGNIYYGYQIKKL